MNFPDRPLAVKGCGQRSHINCQQCSLSELCLPFSLNEQELDTLDQIIQRKKPLHKGDNVYDAGQPLHSLYAVRSGSLKTYTISAQGELQITGFHFAGEVLGFDALSTQKHPSFAQAMETGMICEIPYTTLDELSNSLPALKRQLLRLMSKAIQNEQNMFMLLNRKNASQRMATFLTDLSDRFAARGLSPTTFRLTMTRGDIGNYLGLTVETFSRLLSRFQKHGLITVESKQISICDLPRLRHESQS